MPNVKFKDLIIKDPQERKDMPPVNPSPKLKAVYWDADVDPEQIRRLFRGEIDRVGHIDRVNLYRRLLMTYDWYTLLSLIPPDRLREALSEAVLEHLYPASLKDRYIYARSVLFG
jgi:hypothetical protein